MFDAQVVLSPKSSPLGKLLDQYVCVRITRNDDADIALFERDWNNTLYYFVMNSDEQIYMRYGGRDARGPMTYLDLNSLELALQKGLELHAKYENGELKKTERPKPFFPREIPPLVERTFARNQCVECHLIGDFQLATVIAVTVVAIELAVISWVRHRFMQTPLIRAAVQVAVGGILVFVAGILIGQS